MSLSFNNDGPLGSFFRYICDNGTYKAFYDDLSDGKDNEIDVSKVDVSMDGIELEDREFIAAIKEKREPNGSLAQVLPCMRVLGKLEQIIDPQRKAHAVAPRSRRPPGSRPRIRDCVPNRCSLATDLRRLLLGLTAGLLRRCLCSRLRQLPGGAAR